MLAGVEAKILDTAGHLDLPPGLDGGVDLVLVADHRFPAGTGPLHPDDVIKSMNNGTTTAAQAIEDLCRATANAISPARCPRRPLLAHLFSVLPKIGLSEAIVPGPILAELAWRIARSGRAGRGEREVVLPVAAHGRGAGAAGVPLVAGSDSHHCRDIGRYDSVAATVGAAAAGAVPRGR